MGSRDLRALKQLKLTAEQLESMRRHVDARLPLEACGLLAGSDDIVREVIPVANDARSAVRFRMNPIEQLEAFERIETGGLQLLGVFHSHPAGPDEPSPTDVAEAAYPVVYLIWSHRLGTWQARGFWIERDLISEVELDITGGR